MRTVVTRLVAFFLPFLLPLSPTRNVKSPLRENLRLFSKEDSPLKGPGEIEGEA